MTDDSLHKLKYHQQRFPLDRTQLGINISTGKSLFWINSDSKAAVKLESVFFDWTRCLISSIFWKSVSVKLKSRMRVFISKFLRFEIDQCQSI